MIDERRHVGEIAFFGGDERQLIAARQLQQSTMRITLKTSLWTMKMGR